MNRLVKLVVGIAVVFHSLSAYSTPTLQAFGTNGEVAVFDCSYTSVAHTDCPFGTGFTGYKGTKTSSPTSVNALDMDIRGRAAVSGEVSPTSYLPTLHAYASSNPAYNGVLTSRYGGSSRADSNVWGVQGYKYVGETDFLLTVTATLDSIFSAPDSGKFGNHSGFQVNLFDAAGYTFGYTSSNDVAEPPELCPILYRGLKNKACSNMPSVYAYDGKTLSNSGVTSATISYLLTPGKEFFVSGFLDASVCCGQSVDSSHTLSMQFNDATMLASLRVPGIVAETPEPTSIALFGLGILALVAMRRRA